MRRLLVWLAVLAVLGAAGYFGDAALRSEAQRRVSTALTAELAANDLETRLGGWPFAIALFTRRVPDAAVTARTAAVAVGEQKLTVSDVSVTMGEVALNGDQLLADQVAGRAALDYQNLEKLAGVPVRYADDGRLGLTYQVTVVGRSITIGVSALPVLDASSATIRLTEPRALLNGNQVDLPVDQSLVDSLVKPIDLNLGYGFRVTEITPEQNGLGIAFAADRATFPLR